MTQALCVSGMGHRAERRPERVLHGEKEGAAVADGGIESLKLALRPRPGMG